jgi:hypothetical protein
MRRIVFQLCLVITACGDIEILGMGRSAQPSMLISHFDTALVEIPAAVERGVPFDISFRTIGPMCVTEGATDRVSGHGNELHIRAYDDDFSSDRANFACNATATYIWHRVRVKRDVPGEIVIRLIGRRFNDDTWSYEPAELTRRVMVR